MKILQLSPQFPFPETNGGKIGIASTFKQLSEFAEVTLFCYTKTAPPKEQLQIAESYGKVVNLVHDTTNTPLKIAKSLYLKKSLYINKHISMSALNYLIDLSKAAKFDVIHADHTSMAPLALALKEKLNIPVGLRLHNVEFTIWDRYQEVLDNYNPKKWYIFSQAKKLKNDESELIAKCDICFPITEDDKLRCESIAPKANLVVAGPGINLSNWQRQNVEKQSKTLIHATTYNWIHNIDAVKWFIDDVMPILYSQDNEIKLQLTGSNTPKSFENNQGVELLGFVPEIAEYLSKAGIYVAPLFVGGGIRIKILEAMAMELPVVASPISAEGIKASRNDGLIIAKSSKEFADEIMNLVRTPDYAVSLGKAARKYVIENYSTEKTIGVIYNSYKKMLNC